MRVGEVLPPLTLLLDESGEDSEKDSLTGDESSVPGQTRSPDSPRRGGSWLPTIDLEAAE